jgi:hypothetical protein
VRGSFAILLCCASNARAGSTGLGSTHTSQPTKPGVDVATS